VSDFQLSYKGCSYLPAIGEKLEEVLVCNSCFQTPTLRTRLIFRRGVLLEYKEKRELVKIVGLNDF